MFFAVFLQVLAFAFLVVGRTLAPRNVPLLRRAAGDNSTSSGIASLALDKSSGSYYAVLKAGDSYFRVALDTGSSDLWLISSDCTSSQCSKVPKYPLAYKSSTFQVVNDNKTEFSASYGDGTGVSGFVAREMVTVANITLKDQALGIIDSSNVTLNSDVSGLLGLGFPRLSSMSDSVTNSSPLFSQLAQQGKLEYPLFGLSLNRFDNGSLTLGAVDASVVHDVNQIAWHPVVEFSPFGTESEQASYLQWATPLAGFGTNGTTLAPNPSYPEITNNASLALLDVGLNGIYGPYSDVSRLFEAMDGARLVDSEGGLWAVPCDTKQNMTFTFGEQTITLQPSDYFLGRTSGSPNLCISWPAAQSPSADGVDWHIGTPFLRTVYSVYSYGINNVEAPVIGFYPVTNSTTAKADEENLSSIVTTVQFTPPNSLLATPTDTILPYTFNTSVPAATTGLVVSELATSTYSPIFQAWTTVRSAIPTIAPSYAVFTDSSGAVVTSTPSIAAVTLGSPPGWTGPNGAGRSSPAPVVFTVAILFAALGQWTLCVL